MRGINSDILAVIREKVGVTKSGVTRTTRLLGERLLVIKGAGWVFRFIGQEQGCVDVGFGKSRRYQFVVRPDRRKLASIWASFIASNVKDTNTTVNENLAEYCDYTNGMCSVGGINMEEVGTLGVPSCARSESKSCMYR